MVQHVALMSFGESFAFQNDQEIFLKEFKI